MQGADFLLIFDFSVIIKEALSSWFLPRNIGLDCPVCPFQVLARIDQLCGDRCSNQSINYHYNDGLGHLQFGVMKNQEKW